MRNDTSEQIKNLLFKNPDSNEAKDFMKEVEDKINDASLNHESMDELENLFDKVPDKLKNDNKVNVEDGLELLDETISSIIAARSRQQSPSSQSQDMVEQIKKDNDLREIQKIEKLIAYYNENQLSEEEIKKLETQEKQLSTQLEADKKLLAELKKAEEKIKDNEAYYNEDWHPSLSDVQKHDLWTKGKTPGSQEYNMALREFGIDPASYGGIDKEIENKKKEIEEKEQALKARIPESKKLIEAWEKQKKFTEATWKEKDGVTHVKKEAFLEKLEENINKEKQKLGKLQGEVDRAKRELIALEDQKLDKNWDPRLTEAQKDELKIARFFPGSQEYNRYLREHGITPVEDMAKLEEKIKQEENSLSDIKTKLGIKTEQENLKEIKEAYEEIKNTVISEVQKSINEDKAFKKLSGSELIDKVEELINDKVTNHEKIDTLKKWSNSDKLTKELKEDIKAEISLTKKKPKNEGSNEKLWLKGLAGAAGFVAGIGVNMAVGAVPVLGTGLALYSGARLLYNTGKLACSIATKINKGNEPKWISSIKNKIPEKVKKIAETIFNKPKNPYAKWFVNGMSLGYTVDRIFNIHGKIGEAFNGNKPTAGGDNPIGAKDTEPSTEAPSNQQADTSTPSKDVPDPSKDVPEPSKISKTTKTPKPKPTPSAQEINPIITPEPSFTTGEVMDISGLEYGYAGPGQQAVHLLNERGVGAVFDKMEIINGQEWVHFKQANGAGYAWFPKEQVEELLTNVVKRGGRH